MEKFTARLKIIVEFDFDAENPEQAHHIVSTKLWDMFDDIQITNEIQLEEIEDILSIVQE